VKRKGLNLVFAFLISSCIHALAIGFVVYTIFGNDDNTNISKDKGERLAFGISFAQISGIKCDIADGAVTFRIFALLWLG